MLGQQRWLISIIPATKEAKTELRKTEILGQPGQRVHEVPFQRKKKKVGIIAHTNDPDMCQ
jgi:hypothetical protein